MCFPKHQESLTKSLFNHVFYIILKTISAIRYIFNSPIEKGHFLPDNPFCTLSTLAVHAQWAEIGRGAVECMDSLTSLSLHW